MSGWQDKIFSKLPKSIDLTQLEERLRMTPMKRLEAMLKFRDELAEIKSQRNESQSTKSD